MGCGLAFRQIFEAAEVQFQSASVAFFEVDKFHVRASSMRHFHLSFRVLSGALRLLGSAEYNLPPAFSPAKKGHKSSPLLSRVLRWLLFLAFQENSALGRADVTPRVISFPS